MLHNIVIGCMIIFISYMWLLSGIPAPDAIGWAVLVAAFASAIFDRTAPLVVGFALFFLLAYALQWDWRSALLFAALAQAAHLAVRQYIYRRQPGQSTVE